MRTVHPRVKLPRPLTRRFEFTPSPIMARPTLPTKCFTFLTLRNSWQVNMHRTSQSFWAMAFIRASATPSSLPWAFPMMELYFQMAPRRLCITTSWTSVGSMSPMVQIRSEAMHVGLLRCLSLSPALHPRPLTHRTWPNGLTRTATGAAAVVPTIHSFPGLLKLGG